MFTVWKDTSSFLFKNICKHVHCFLSHAVSKDACHTVNVYLFMSIFMIYSSKMSGPQYYIKVHIALRHISLVFIKRTSFGVSSTDTTSIMQVEKSDMCLT